MNKQERNRVRTPEDLERKYNFVAMQKAIQLNEDGLTKTTAEMEGFVDSVLGSLDNMQNQIDGKVDTYYYNGVPSLENLPAAEWEEEDYPEHVGDLYYDKDTGTAYRFLCKDNLYVWEETKDKVAEVLAVANDAKDTADSKRRIFVTQPAAPYDIGDLWLKDKEIYVCRVSKLKNESYDENDFESATDYANKQALNNLANEVEAQGRVILVLSSKSITTENLKASLAELGFASAEEIEAKIASFGYMTSETAEIKFAKIDLTNIDKAWVQSLMVKGNLITDDITAATGNFTNYLTGVRIIGDLIEGDTIKADALILLGEDGIYRRLNINALGEAVVNSDEKYNKGLDGSVLVKESVTAEKIAVKELSALTADIGVITSGEIIGLLLRTVNLETSKGKIGGFEIDETGLRSAYDYTFATYDFLNNPLSDKINVRKLEGYSDVGLITDFIDVKLLDSYTIKAESPAVVWPYNDFKAESGDNHYVTDITKFTLKLVLVYSNDGNTVSVVHKIDITNTETLNGLNENYKYVALGFCVVATGKRIYELNESVVTLGDYGIDFFSDSYLNADVTYTMLLTTYKPKLVINAVQTGSAKVTPLEFRYGPFGVNCLGEVFVEDEELETLWSEHMA